ncbi:four helix bundle protein [Candidatus Campbellbacteria bacterium RIFOXYC2_FULL_35_25]|uniref:Four helix bundle protein n=1 Tax=Candidatus Campbellbacteria bacterium RIFOXYC2_FULL_35_25 TaxID=1797582 RepID=A0A1F5EHE5_9BACT|nr:MAG: four helix bundle protein [Candidatus Campbellbacteria bacterium RIFOXYC2_FULL_35_25]
MSISKSFKDSIVWQKSIELSVNIYNVTENFNESEKFGLISQMRRCAVSIPSNIAEGSKRKTNKDFAQFLRIASGSAAELETQIIIAQRIYLNIEFKEISSLLLEIQKMLTVIIRKIN